MNSLCARAQLVLQTVYIARHTDRHRDAENDAENDVQLYSYLNLSSRSDLHVQHPRLLTPAGNTLCLSSHKEGDGMPVNRSSCCL
jgi:hypothetical protein